MAKKQEKELTERQKWLRKPWTVKSFVLTPDGGRRPYDPDRDLLDHIVKPEVNYFSGGTASADWKPEYKEKLAEMDRQAVNAENHSI